MASGSPGAPSATARSRPPGVARQRHRDLAAPGEVPVTVVTGSARVRLSICSGAGGAVRRVASSAALPVVEKAS